MSAAMLGAGSRSRSCTRAYPDDDALAVQVGGPVGLEAGGGVGELRGGQVACGVGTARVVGTWHGKLPEAAQVPWCTEARPPEPIKAPPCVRPCQQPSESAPISSVLFHSGVFCKTWRRCTSPCPGPAQGETGRPCTRLYHFSSFILRRPQTHPSERSSPRWHSPAPPPAPAPAASPCACSPSR
jgi:hypothetical protein